LSEFTSLATRIIEYLPNVISGREAKNDYDIFSSEIAGTLKFVRPINRTLFLGNSEVFQHEVKNFREILQKLKEGGTASEEEKRTIDRILYTIQQSIGAGLDLLVNPNSSRKHVGNRFEELIKVVFDEIGVTNKKVVLKIPYPSKEGQKTYKCENDLILSPFPEIKSTSTDLDPKEVVLSIKTTSKDRMGKIFIDKILLERFIGQPQKVIGIFLNDVQRKGTNNISYTLVSGLFMVYTEFLTELDGIYYLDPPPGSLVEPYTSHMKRFSELICNDIRTLLAT